MTDSRSGYEIALERIAACKKNTSLTYLDLSNLSLNEWPETLFELDHLTVLNLGSNWLYEEAKNNWVLYKDQLGIPFRGRHPIPEKNNLPIIHPKIKQLWKLEHLNLDGNEITSFENLPELPFLKSLNLNDNHIADLGPFPSFPMLEHLELKKNEIKSIHGNFDLPSLRCVHLETNQIKTLENLRLFPNAVDIHLSQNDISSIGSNNQLDSLNHLNLYTNRLSSLENLDVFPNLISLHLGWNRWTDLKNLSAFPKLIKLDLSGCYIHKIPPNALNLPNLRQLNLESNGIKKIENLDKVPQLLELELGWNEIKRIENLDHLFNLRSLLLRANQIRKIKNLDKLPELKILDLGCNEIGKIENLDKIPKLQELYLHENHLRRIENLHNLPNLSYLTLMYNRIQKVENLDDLKALTFLNLDLNIIEVIENLNALTNLSVLLIRENPTKRFGAYLHLPALRTLLLGAGELQVIEHLDLPLLDELGLGGNQIEKLEGLQNSPRLTCLNLHGNKIHQIDPDLNLPQLDDLDLEDNSLNTLHGLQHFPNLKKLNAADNQIESIETPFPLIHLEELNLKKNKLRQLEQLGQLTALKKLFLQENQIQQVHATNLAHFPALETLTLKNNPIGNLPPELLEGKSYSDENCLTDLQQWFAELAIASTPNTDFKIIICGNGGVGKSRILDRLLDRPGFVHNWDSTHGIRIEHQVKPDPQHADRQISLNFWDFGGQTLYHAAHRLFMRYRSVFLVVWDPEHEPYSNTYSTDPWGNVYLNEKLAYWVGSIHTQAESSPMVVFQNKVDEPTTPPLEPGLNLLPASIQENCQIEYGSAKNALRIANLQQQLLQAIQSLPEYGQMMPLSWMLVRDALLQELQDAENCRNMISLEEFESLCREKGVLESTIKAKSLLYFLQRTGLLFYSSWYFADHIILNQQWAIDAIYAILDRRTALFAKIKSQQGVFAPADLFAAWADMGYDEPRQQLFFNFMQSYRICLLLDKEKVTERYVLGMLLPESPDQAWQAWPLHTSTQKRAFIYQHPYYLHAQDMSSFLGDLLSYNRLIINALWKNGVILQGKNPENQARISLDFTEKKILIETIGPEAENFIQFIRYRFSNIYRSKMPLLEWASIDGSYFIDNERIRNLYFSDEELKMLPGPGGSSIDVKRFEWAKEWYSSVYEFDH